MGQLYQKFKEPFIHKKSQMIGDHTFFVNFCLQTKPK